MVSLLLVAVVVTFLLGVLLVYVPAALGQDAGDGSAAPPAASAESLADEIEARLAATGVYCLPAGEHVIDRPVRVRSRQRLSGSGLASVLRYKGPGDVAVYFGETEAAAYAIELCDLTISGGGVVAEHFGQHSRLRNVWIANAPGDGLALRGVGDRFAVVDLVVWGAAGAGVRVSAAGPNNGLMFIRPSVQACGGPGLILETVAETALLYKPLIRDGTIQGNAKAPADGTAGVEVLIRGWVQRPHLDNVWIENGKRDVVGLRVEGRGFVGASGPIVTRRPAWLRVSGDVGLLTRAAELVDCWECDTAELITPRGKVYWRSAADGVTRSTYTTAPGGAAVGEAGLN